MVFQNAGVSAVVLVGTKGKSVEDSYEVIDYGDESFNKRTRVDMLPVLQDAKHRFILRNASVTLQSQYQIGDYYRISRGEELGKKGLPRASSPIPSGNVGVVTGSGIDRFIVPSATHYANREQVRKPFSNYQSPKVVVVKTGNEIVATVDDHNQVTLQSVYNLHPLGKFSCEVACATLNSNIVNEWMKHLVTNQKKLFPQLTQGNIMEVPMPDLSEEQSDAIVYLVRQAATADEQEYKIAIGRIEHILLEAYGVLHSGSG